MDVPAEIFLDWGLQRMETFYARQKEVSFKNLMKGQLMGSTSSAAYSTAQWNQWSQQQASLYYQPVYTYAGTNNQWATTSTITTTANTPSIFSQLTKTIFGT